LVFDVLLEGFESHTPCGCDKVPRVPQLVGIDEQVDVVGFTVHFDEFVLVVKADAWEHSK
jgi:hypothetical protein